MFLTKLEEGEYESAEGTTIYYVITENNFDGMLSYSYIYYIQLKADIYTMFVFNPKEYNREVDEPYFRSIISGVGIC